MHSHAYYDTNLVLMIHCSALTLTAQENEEINDKARWLRCVVNPFVDFYIIMAIGAAGSPTATGAARGREDRPTRDHAKDL